VSDTSTIGGLRTVAVMSEATSDRARLDPRTDRFLADPHAVYDELRAVGGVVPDPIGWSTISYAAGDAAFRDPALIPGIDPLLEQLGIGALWGERDHTLTNAEGADHQRLRRAVSPWFTVRRIEALRARTRALVAECLDRGNGGLDVMADLADVVPARLFCWMIGAPEADAELLACWSKHLISVFTADPAMAEPVRRVKAEMAEYSAALLEERRRRPGDDLTTVLARAEDAGDLLPADVDPLLEELLSASVDNTANTAALSIWTLARRPADWATLAAEPGRLADALEECGRFEPSIRHTIKYARHDTELQGRPIPAGTFVTIRIAAAQRDPAVYERPHELDLRRRQPSPLLSFGAGRHYCLGAALGRMEIQEMVAGLLGRWSAVRVGDDVDMNLNGAGIVFRLPLEPSEVTR
jgi:cytochrome P450